MLGRGREPTLKVKNKHVRKRLENQIREKHFWEVLGSQLREFHKSN